MNDIKKMFESWRNFLDSSKINEARNQMMSDRTIGPDKMHAITFVKFFVKSKETAEAALKMIESSIEDYEKLKTLPIESEEYRSRAKGILKDPNAVVEDEMIDKYIKELQNIRLHLIEEMQYLN